MLRATVVMLLATDSKNSVIGILSTAGFSSIAYDPFGYHLPSQRGIIHSQFNGEHFESRTVCYMLGGGHRVYKPLFGIFLSPDSSSPFGKGGLNGYMYCLADPINRIDPTGRFSIRSLFGNFFRRWSRQKPDLVVSRKTYAPLTNKLARELPKELNTLHAARTKAPNKFPITLVKTNEQLSSLQFNSGTKNKYILTDQNELIVGSSPKYLEIKHAAYAHYSASELGTSENVIAAGEIGKGRYKSTAYFFFNSESGHYQPRFNRAKLAAEKIREMGVAAKAVPRSIRL